MRRLAQGRTSFAAGALAALSVLLEPDRTFRRLRDSSPILAPWLVASGLSMLLTFPVISITERASAHLMADLPPSVSIDRVRESLDRAKILSLAITPAALLARWIPTAALLWAPAVFFTGRARYAAALSVVAYSATPQLLGQAIDVLVTWKTGPEFTPDMVPVFRSATSFVGLLPDASARPWTAAALERLTPFSIWTLVLWAIGLRAAFGTSWRRAAGITVPVWLVLQAFSTASHVVGSSLLGAVVERR